MADADIERPLIPHVPTPARGASPWLRGMACVAILPLLGFIGQNGSQLWGEFCSLRKDQGEVRSSEIVGYVDINPSPNYARCPDGWVQSDGATLQLWAGWRDGEHRWFNIGTVDYDPYKFSTPMGRDTIRAIDHPLFEQAGGKRWLRVGDDARVAGLRLGGEAIAYPWTILDKVEVVNDTVGDRPVLVAFMPIEEEISFYEATLDGKRVTFGLGGYFAGYQPVLYDRGTESLWTRGDEAMVAVAGPRKGTSLKRIERARLISWSSWKSDHPGGKLLIGADRSKPRPAE